MENLTLLFLSFCCCELLYKQNAKDMFAFYAVQAVVGLFSQGFNVYLGQSLFLCLKCVLSFAKLHSSLRIIIETIKSFLQESLLHWYS